MGSSPRMRGTPLSYYPHSGKYGIIPAHAGNTSFWFFNSASGRDHPRACGEHYRPIIITGVHSGSSPRMRGTLGYEACDVSGVGIIPAHAGNTAASVASWVSVGDHPRACGEHDYTADQIVHCKGSSPRMRGTPSARYSLPNAYGIIPAHAGNTMFGYSFMDYNWDHPRACGEHVAVYVPVVPFGGSSPRMRGTLSKHIVLRHQSGIIPAHAGNTICNGCCTLIRGDHPRACGEHRSCRRRPG